MHVIDLHRRSVEGFVDRVRELEGAPDGTWGRPTPCADWDVRTLVNHVVYEDVWAVPLMEGAKVDEVGDRFEGDLLGDDPIRAADAAGQAAITAAASAIVAGRTVHLSFGDNPAEEYTYQLAADHVIHGWDLAVAIGGDTSMDDDMVAPLASWFAEREELYRSAGAIGERPASGGEPGNAWHELLLGFGRDPGWTAG
jgi:uncharacterized protein (TIGR03086 family)